MFDGGIAHLVELSVEFQIIAFQYHRFYLEVVVAQQGTCNLLLFQVLWE